MKREPAQHFQDLIVWQKAHQFVSPRIIISGNFPANETYGLISQFRRTAIAIPTHIAEGFKKKTKPDKARCMNISQASLEECRYDLILAKDLGYGDGSGLMSLLEEVSKVLESYTSSILGAGS